MKKISYDQVIRNAISHLNNNYTKGQLGFTKVIHLNEEMSALVSGIVDSINECMNNGYEGKTVKMHDDYLLLRSSKFESGADDFSRDQAALCIEDNGEYITIENGGYEYSLQKGLVYLSEEDVKIKENEIKIKHPVQPLVEDEYGVIRFKENKIVQYLLDKGPIDMNHLALEGFSQEDEEQFAQLIGYSLSGFGDLSYVSDETYNRASDQKP